MSKDELIKIINDDLQHYEAFFTYGKFRLKKQIIGTKTTMTNLQKAVKWLEEFKKHNKIAMKMWQNQSPAYWLNYHLLHGNIMPEEQIMRQLIKDLKNKLSMPPAILKAYKGIVKG